MARVRPRSARRFVVRALRRAHVLRPRLCLLVSGGDSAELDATLHALRALPRADLVVLVAAAPGSAGAEVAATHVHADWRVRATAPEWPAAARAAARLRSRYVVALRAGELPDTGGLDAAMRSVGRGRPGLGVGSGLLLADPAAAVFDRRTWRSVLGAGSAGAALVSALALTPDAVRLPGVPTRLTDGATVRGMVDTRPALAGWLSLQRIASDLLDGPLYAAWAVSALAGEAQRFLQDAERFDHAQWAGLRERVGALARLTGEDDLARIPVEGRVRVALAAGDRRRELVDFVAARRFSAGQYPTTASDGAAYAVLPVPEDLPAELLRLSPAETALHLSVRRLRWAGDRLALELFASVAGVDTADHAPDVTARLVSSAGQRLDLAVELAADREVTRWMGTHHVNHDLGLVRAEVPLAALAVPGRWTVEVSVSVAGMSRAGVVTDSDPAGSVAVLRPRLHEGVTVAAEVDPGFALVAAPRPLPEGPSTGPLVEDLVVDGGWLTVRGTGVDRLALHGPHGPVAAEHADGGASWSLRHDPWGFGPEPLPAGRYVLTAAGDRGVELGEALGDRLPEVVLTDDHRVVVRREDRSGGHALVLVLGPPLADDEVGPYCQRRLQEWYADPRHQLDDHAVYLQAYTGQHATDSPLAIAEELTRTRPDLDLTWAVADRASRVTPAAGTVLWRSRAWYSALARSRYVVTNIELESWFRRRPGQEVLQTFHGYPSKAMGLGLWRQKHFTRTRIEQQLDRTSRNWSLLLTPTPDMDVHYREQYRYDGPILAAGYPRDDLLVSPRAEAVRAETRKRLGLADDTIAVLYAPTWRDDQATDFRSARLVDHLDVAAAAEALGPGYVLLLRGHRFMSATGGHRSRVLDVTDYPEINDLVLAADAAVLDYSSLRFDFALTGRPMIFLVPDLETYATTKRGFLYDFVPTAPGPLARSSAEVIEALRDLDGVRERHRDDYERFNATYNRFQDGHAAERVVERFFRMTPP